MPPSRQHIIGWLFQNYGSPESENDPEQVLDDMLQHHYVAIEVGTGQYNHRRWYSTGDDSVELIEMLLNQEQGDWEWPEVYDLVNARHIEWENKVRITGSNPISPEIDDIPY